MRDQKTSLHAIPIVPSPNFAPGDVWYPAPWTTPSVEDLAKNRPPIPNGQAVPKELKNSPWLLHDRNEAPGGFSPESAARYGQDQAMPALSPLLAVLTALGYPSIGGESVRSAQDLQNQSAGGGRLGRLSSITDNDNANSSPPAQPQETLPARRLVSRVMR